jgi:hypothetical protein
MTFYSEVSDSILGRDLLLFTSAFPDECRDSNEMRLRSLSCHSFQFIIYDHPIA